jgi:hypothetical protein
MHVMEITQIIGIGRMKGSKGHGFEKGKKCVGMMTEIFGDKEIQQTWKLTEIRSNRGHTGN